MSYSTVPTVCSKVSWNAHYGCIYYWFCRISGHLDIPANLKAGYRQSSVTGFRISGVTGNRISVESGNGSSGFFPYPEKCFWKKITYLPVRLSQYHVLSCITDNWILAFSRSRNEQQSGLSYCVSGRKTTIQGWEFAHLLIRSFCSNQMSDCERFAQVAHDKWANERFAKKIFG